MSTEGTRRHLQECDIASMTAESLDAIERRTFYAEEWRTSMSVSRNALCPCGSGKKYKRCHGQLSTDAAVSLEVARANVLKALDTSLGDRLMRFARMRHGPDWLENVLQVHGLLDDREPSQAELSFIVPWLQHFMVNDAAGSTLADAWREHNRQRITPDERVLLDAYDSAWVSLWEVREIQPGVGSRLTDVLTGEERFALDVSSSKTLRQFDTLLAIILTCDGVSFFGGAHAQPLPPRSAEFVTREARRLCRVRTRPVTQDKLRDPEMQLDLLALWNAAVQNMLSQPAQSLQNTDGDPFALTTDDFALVGGASRDEVANRLASLPGAEGPEHDGDDIAYAVTKAGNAMHRSWENTVVGRIVLSATRLTVETNSTRRADALRSTLETHLRGLVRFRLRKEQNTGQLIAAARAQGRGRRHEPVSEQPPPEALLALRQFRERHMIAWLDEPIPALGGLTPREAARSPRSRSQLEALLNEFDQHEARLPEQQRIDLRPVRSALGFS